MIVPDYNLYIWANRSEPCFTVHFLRRVGTKSSRDKFSSIMSCFVFISKRNRKNRKIIKKSHTLKRVCVYRFEWVRLFFSLSTEIEPIEKKKKKKSKQGNPIRTVSLVCFPLRIFVHVESKIVDISRDGNGEWVQTLATACVIMGGARHFESETSVDQSQSYLAFRLKKNNKIK